MELLKDLAQAFEDRMLALPQTAQRMHRNRNVDEMGKVVRQIGREPVQILCSPRIINVSKHFRRFRHSPPPFGILPFNQALLAAARWSC
jgi:hypothetical protein